MARQRTLISAVPNRASSIPPYPFHPAAVHSQVPRVAACAVPAETYRRAWWIYGFVTAAMLSLMAAMAHGDAALLAVPDTLERVMDGGAPRTVDELRAMQSHVQKLAEHVRKCTVGIQIGPAHGSGVLISEDGYVMTVAHVASRPGLTASILLPDGERVAAKTLGMSWDRDASLLKITVERKWPHLTIGDSSSVQVGQWCAAVGHPGGFDIERGPVFRLGRVLGKGDFMRTDCQLVGGDSGGPLVNLKGEVIGIHSRIGNSLANNQHVPVSAYQESWDRLVSGELWGLPKNPYIGVKRDLEVEDAKIAMVDPDSPAEKAGLKPGDTIIRFDDRDIRRFDDLVRQVRRREPGDQVEVEVQRGMETVQLKITIGDQVPQFR